MIRMDTMSENESNENNGQAGNVATASGGNSSVAATVVTELTVRTQCRLDKCQGAMLAGFVKTELFGKNFPVVNEDSFEAHPWTLGDAMNVCAIPQSLFLQHKGALMKFMQSKLANYRSALKKSAKKACEGEGCRMIADVGCHSWFATNMRLIVFQI